MIVFILGLIDLIGSIFVFLTLTKAQVLPAVGLFFSALLILKSLYSLLVNIGSNEKSYFAAATDIIAAVLIALSTLGVFVHYAVVALVGILLFVKSMQSIIPEVMG